jgi:hypothetical protein
MGVRVVAMARSGAGEPPYVPRVETNVPSATLRTALTAGSVFELAPAVIEGCLGSGAADALFVRARREGLDGLELAQRRGALPAATGEIAEAASAVILTDLGFSLVWQITRPGVTGADLVMLTPAQDALLAVEVKGTLRAGYLPRMSGARGGQMSRAWIDPAHNPALS